MNILDVLAVSKRFALRPILDQASFRVDEIEKVGLIGANGSGKSTLLRIIAGVESPDGGTVSFRRGASVGYLAQEPDLDDRQTVAAAVAGALSEVSAMLVRYEAVTEELAEAAGDEALRTKRLNEQERLAARLHEHDAWALPHRIDTVLEQLGLPEKEAVIGTLSGGLRKRVALARLILQAPDLLLLDEPTNHLDAATTAWLEDFLSSYPKAVVFVTHDRYFLDRVAQRIVEVDRGALTAYPGNYSRYLEARAERLSHDEQAHGRLITLLRKESAWIARGPRARATKSKHRVERYGELTGREAAMSAKGRSRIALNFTGDRAGDVILSAAGLGKTFGDRTIFSGASFTLSPGARLGVIGSNGCGKSTLLKVLLGLEPATTGRVTTGPKTRIGYLDQARSGLDPDGKVGTALGEGEWVTVNGRTRHMVGYLAEFLFTSADLPKPIVTLSGGERARLLLAKLMLEGANCLILDEPTNDLDIPTLQILDEALITFTGGVVMVTHDRFFLDKVATAIVSFEPGPSGSEVRLTEGNFESYRAGRTRLAEASPARPASPDAEPPNGRTKTGFSYRDSRALAEVEAGIAALERRRTEVAALLADPTVFAGDAGRVSALGEEFGTIDRELEGWMKRWEALERKRGGA